MIGARLLLIIALAGGALVTLPACKRAPASGDGRRTVVIGIIGKSQSNDVFRVAEAGAKAAARELADKYDVNIVIEVRTPSEEDPIRQAEAIEALVRRGVDGIAISSSEANSLVATIDRAVGKGVHVMTFDSDVPQSKRFAFYGASDADAGQRTMELLAQAMGEKGVVAILGGNESAPNLQARVNGARNAVSAHPAMALLKPNAVFYHQETPEKSAEAVAIATNANPQIEGWAFVGGWPLFTNNALRWEPGKIKVVSMDALPAQLNYVRTGHVHALLAQDCFGWGYTSVDTILAKVVNAEDPPDPRLVDPLTVVTKDNVDEWAGNWDKWLAND